MDLVQTVVVFTLLVIVATEIYIYHEIMRVEANTRVISRQMETVDDELQNITNNIYSVYWLVKGNNHNENSTEKTT